MQGGISADAIVATIEPLQDRLETAKPIVRLVAEVTVQRANIGAMVLPNAIKDSRVNASCLVKAYEGVRVRRIMKLAIGWVKSNCNNSKF